MNDRIRLGLLGLTGLLLSGCGILPTSETGYQSAARVEKPLEVPPDLLGPGRDDRFSVPASGAANRSDFERQRASSRGAAVATGVLPAVPGMQVQQLAGQSILVVEQSAERLWPILRQFWLDSGFLIAEENPATGLLETDWAEDRSKIPDDLIRRTIGRVFERVYDSGLRDKFRMRLERLGPNQTEISVTHRGLIEVYKGGTDNNTTTWTNRPADRQLEGDFIRRIMLRLGEDEGKARAAVAAAVGMAQLVRTAERAEITLAEGFDRAWRRVGVAIDRLGFTVEDRDRSKGVFFVRYRDPTVDTKEKQTGFFGRIFSGTGPTGESAAQYQVEVRSAGEKSTVRVLSEQGAVVNDANAKQMLDVLFEQLR
ncbi:MAG: hypothetical protein RLZZ344_1184 [Pseudomonadota bacterium]